MRAKVGQAFAELPSSRAARGAGGRAVAPVVAADRGLIFPPRRCASPDLPNRRFSSFLLLLAGRRAAPPLENSPGPSWMGTAAAVMGGGRRPLALRRRAA